MKNPTLAVLLACSLPLAVHAVDDRAGEQPAETPAAERLPVSREMADRREASFHKALEEGDASLDSHIRGNMRRNPESLAGRLEHAVSVAYVAKRLMENDDREKASHQGKRALALFDAVLASIPEDPVFDPMRAQVHREKANLHLQLFRDRAAGVEELESAARYIDRPGLQKRIARNRAADRSQASEK